MEQTLAQKELQLLELQGHQVALYAERDGLRGALQLLKSQHSSALKDAQEQTQRVMVSYECALLSQLPTSFHLQCNLWPFPVVAAKRRRDKEAQRFSGAAETGSKEP